MACTPGTASTGQAVGAELLAVPALDFEVDDWSQSRVQLMRGVESGFSTARASRQGYLTLSDGYGRVLAETGSDDDGIATVSLSRDLALGNGPTWYARFGDVFSWLCVMIALGSVLGLVATRRRITKSSAH
jgi:apolipoprotein N-acyltransferase